MEDIQVFQCSHIGVSGTTNVHVKHWPNKFEARCGIAIMGLCHMDSDLYTGNRTDPFSSEFYDNYASGEGKTKEEAIEALKRDMENIANAMWEIEGD